MQEITNALAKGREDLAGEAARIRLQLEHYGPYLDPALLRRALELHCELAGYEKAADAADLGMRRVLDIQRDKANGEVTTYVACDPYNPPEIVTREELAEWYTTVDDADLVYVYAQGVPGHLELLTSKTVHCGRDDLAKYYKTTLYRQGVEVDVIDWDV